jgi:fructuronate reductase
VTFHPRLCAATLHQLPASVARPGYDRASLTSGIVHLGIGAFHRAHQAAYTQAVLATGDHRWGIIGASLRSPATRDALAAQDGLYALNIRGDNDQLAIIGSIQSVLVAPEDPAALLDRLCHPDVAIASLTVTEKAYCQDPATGHLDPAHADIVHDLANPGAPRSALGFLAAAIARRRAEGLAPVTVLCCDNLPANGRTLHRLLTEYAALVSPGLAAFVANEIACPDTMVDRIVPATTDEDCNRVADAMGLIDAWPVVAEPFTQWVIEDRFTAGRPAWQAGGATLVADVAPFEAMKLRLLNGSHSALAYLGYLAGYQTVAETMRDPGIAGFVQALMADASETLTLPAGWDVDAYQRSLIARFHNPALKHRTWQIAMDGSQKLPQRLLGPIRDRLAQGRPIDRHAFAVAAWMRYVAGTDEAGNAIDVRDPFASEFATLARNAGPVAERLAPALLGISAIFGHDLPANPVFRAAVVEALSALYASGSRRVAAQMSEVA